MGWLWLVNKIIGLFCKRALSKRQYSAKETYNFIDPTDRSHPIYKNTEILSCIALFFRRETRRVHVTTRVHVLHSFGARMMCTCVRVP